MKLIKSSFEILEQGPGLEGIYEAIERAGRTCYASSHNIKYKYINPLTPNTEYDSDYVSIWSTGDGNAVTMTAKEFYDKYGVFIRKSITAKSFVDRMKASEHYAMLEHGTVYLKRWYSKNHWEVNAMISKYSANPYSRVIVSDKDKYGDRWVCVTTNYRVLVENGWLRDLQYLYEPTESHEKRVTVRFITDQGVLREFTRHRKFSFAVESTRYCNYSADRFDNEVTFILPTWCNTMEEGDYGTEAHPLVRNRGHKDGIFSKFVESLQKAEKDYLYLLKEGWKPEQARNVLPLATKCDMIMTGFVSDFKHFFDLRALGTTGKPHPQAKELAEPLMGEFYKRGYIK